MNNNFKNNDSMNQRPASPNMENKQWFTRTSQGEASNGQAQSRSDAVQRMSSVTTNSDKAQKKSGKRTVLIVLGIVVVAIVIWLLVWLFACNGSSVFDPSAQSGQAPYKSQEEIQAELDRTVEEGMFNISIASVIQFDEGTTPGTAYIENVPGNRYLMQVTITDDDTGDVLYESGVLRPNQYIEEITLAKDLDPGSYDTTATFTALDQTTYDEIGTAAAKVSINVLG